MIEPPQGAPALMRPVDLQPLEGIQSRCDTIVKELLYNAAILAKFSPDVCNRINKLNGTKLAVNHLWRRRKDDGCQRATRQC